MFVLLTSVRGCSKLPTVLDLEKLYQRIGEHIRQYRKACQLSQAALAQRVALSRTSITNIENGRQKLLVHQLYAIANVLKIGPQNLLPLSVTPEPGQLSTETRVDLEKYEGPVKEWATRVISKQPSRKEGNADEKGGYQRVGRRSTSQKEN